jgi:hypothetical protein
MALAPKKATIRAPSSNSISDHMAMHFEINGARSGLSEMSTGLTFILADDLTCERGQGCSTLCTELHCED